MKNKENVIFTPPHPLKTAVLFLVFNRIETTEQVFAAIRQAKPPRLYVAADGAREDKPGEDLKVKAVREYVINEIDWDCEVKTLFRDKNLGCRYAVSGAITWFFENEERGIILEDDCLPNQSFFWFCEELLEKYKNNMEIWHIGGSNFQSRIMGQPESYYFSIFNHVWGWATWRNRWKFHDVELTDMEDDLFLSKIFKSSDLNYWKKIFRKVKIEKFDSWAYLWSFKMWEKGGLAVVPNLNMVSNIGYGREATHTSKKNPILALKTYEMRDVIHPEFVSQNIGADKFTSKYVFGSGRFFGVVPGKIRFMFLNFLYFLGTFCRRENVGK
jgi:hypothetical protein